LGNISLANTKIIVVPFNFIDYICVNIVPVMKYRWQNINW